MGAQVIQVTNIVAGITIAASNARKLFVGSGAGLNDLNTETEANVETKFQTAGTWSNIEINISTNSSSTAGSIQSRVNGNNGNQSQTITGSTTGRFIDTTHTDSVAAGDRLCIILTQGSGGACTLNTSSSIFQATGTNTVSRLVCAKDTIADTATATGFAPICGSLGTAKSTTEANNKVRVRRAGTLSNFGVRCSAQTWSSPTCTVNKNGTGTGMTVTLPSGAALTEDTTHTSSVAAGDDLDYALGAKSGSGSMTVKYAACNFETDTNYGMCAAAVGAGYTQTKNTTRHYALGGELGASSAESWQQARANFAFTFSDITTLITAASAVTATLRFRKNAGGSATNQTITSTANTPGVYSDTTHTDVVAAGDLINAQIVTGTTSGTNNTTINSIVINSYISTTTRVTNSNTLLYNIVGRVINSNTLKYNVLKQVVQSNTLKYNLLKQILNSNTLKYNVLKQITNSTTLKYNIIGRIVNSQTLKYNLLKGILKTNTLKYNILQQVAKSQTLKYNLLKQITKSNTLLYNVVSGALTRVTHSNTLFYNLLQQVSKSNTLKYNLLLFVRSLRLFDDFEAGTYSFTEGGYSPNNKWKNSFLSGGTSGVRYSASANSNVMWLIPQAATNTSQTYSVLNQSTSKWENIDLTVRVKTVSQTRINDPPYNWERAWIFFRTIDNDHGYYFVMKDSGCELGREDLGIEQIFVATPSNTYPLGYWNTVRISCISDKPNNAIKIKVWVDGTLIIDVSDDPTLIPATPPSAAMFAEGTIGVYGEDCEAEFDVVQTAGPVIKYNVLKQVTKQNTLKYNIIGRVVHANTLLYNVIVSGLSRVTQQNTLKYNVLKQVTYNNTLKYNLLKTVVKSNTLKYNIIGRVIHSNTLLYNLRKQVIHSNTLKYNLLKQITKTNTLLYNIYANLNRVTHSQTLKYNIVGRVTHSDTLKYNLLKQIAKQNTLKYNLLKQVLRSNTLRYNLRKQIIHSNTLKYNIRQRIIHSNTLQYNLLKQVVKQNTLRYNLLKQILRSNTLRYNVKQQVIHALTLLYNVFGPIYLQRTVRAFTLRYRIKRYDPHTRPNPIRNRNRKDDLYETIQKAIGRMKWLKQRK